MKSLIFYLLVLCAVIKTQAQIELKKDSKTGKFGYIDENDAWAIQPQFEAAEDFYGYDFAFVKKGGKWGLMNIKGEIVLPFAYDKPGYESDSDLFPVVKNKKRGMINKATGIESIPCLYDRLDLLNDLYWNDTVFLLAVKEGKAGVIDMSGKVIIDFLYDSKGKWPFMSIETNLKAGVISAIRNKKSGLIDNQGNVLVPFQYDKVEVRDYIEYSDTLLFDISVKKKFGLYSAELKKEIVPPIYDERISFEENYAIVSRNKKYGIIDRTGKEVLPCKFTSDQAMDELMEKLYQANN